MVGATLFLQPGWRHLTRGASTHDPITGEAIAGEPAITTGTGLVQQPLWTGMEETTPTAVKDERIIMFAPAIDVAPDDEFISPSGKVWQAITEGIPRGIPGKPPEYTATRARRAKEKEQ